MASLKLAGNTDFRFALSRCRNPESPVAVIPSSRTREPRKLNTDDAPRPMIVEAAPARSPVSRLIELRTFPWLPPNTHESRRSPPAINGDPGVLYWPPLTAEESVLAGVFDARSVTWRIISESPDLRDNALKIDAADKSIPRETACSDSPRFRATPSMSDRLSIEDNEASIVDIETSVLLRLTVPGFGPDLASDQAFRAQVRLVQLMDSCGNEWDIYIQQKPLIPAFEP